jgi:heme-degrading monooxygenase HmoA
MMMLMTVSATFIFALRELDERFYELNDEIARRAREIPGFLGEEAWHNEATGLHSEVYYWETADVLRELIAMETHDIAKGLADNWIAEYRVVIAEVQSVYGSPSLGLDHVPPGTPALSA